MPQPDISTRFLFGASYCEIQRVLHMTTQIYETKFYQLSAGAYERGGLEGGHPYKKNS